MGRVFEAMKRANAAKNNGAGKTRREEGELGRTDPGTSTSTPETPIEKLDINSPSNYSISLEGSGSASSAHTANVPGGLALLGGIASGDAGATLDAVGATRVGEFVSYDISPTRVEPHLVAVSQPRSAYCEQFRSLRTKLLQAGERQQMRAVVITSAGVGEGKTLTALNLAWMLAQTEGMRALIIDSDLRQPCATEYLGIEVEHGLSDVLGGTLPLEKAIIRLDPAGLYLLPGGKAREDVAELLSGPSYARLLTDVRKMFDFIIIDAPPLGIFTDANVLMNRADGALIVVRSRKTRYALLEKLLEQLPTEKILGVVLNRVDEEFNEAAYYYQRGYYQRNRGIARLNLSSSPGDSQNEVAI